MTTLTRTSGGMRPILGTEVRMKTLEQVTRLHALRDMSIDVVLFKLEDVQAQKGLPDLSALERVQLLAQEFILKQLIDEIYAIEFEEGCNG
jgi:hypothetical protein